jgi:hypothetical protein
MRSESLFISLTSARKVGFYVKDFDRSTSARFNYSRGWCVFGSTRFPKKSASDIDKTYPYASRRIRIICDRLVLFRRECTNSGHITCNFFSLTLGVWIIGQAEPFRPKKKSWCFPCIHEHSHTSGRLPKGDRAKSIFSFELTHMHPYFLDGARTGNTDFPGLRNALNQF